MNQFGYKEILLNQVVPFISVHYAGEDPVIHQDNDPKHNSLLIRSLLEVYDLRNAQAPAYSPDLNPIEMVWSALRRLIRKRRCSSQADIRIVVAEFCRTKLSSRACQRYISNLKKV